MDPGRALGQRPQRRTGRGTELLGRGVADDPIPYFFTDQYEIGMEYTGWFPPGRYDSLVTRGECDSAACHTLWLADDRVVAGMHVNRWDDGIEPAQELIRTGLPVDPHRLADPSVPLDRTAAAR